MKDDSAAIQYSIVIPVYNSEKTLNELVSRLLAVMDSITDNYEIIFVDDCSIDKSWEKLNGLRACCNKIKIIHLLRNFGQHNALVCGLNYCSGEYVIMMDDDLQNPPEEIPRLIRKIEEGYWVVYGKYTRKMHATSENFMSKIFHKFIHSVLAIPDDIYISNFVICRKEVAKNITRIKSAYPFITALIVKSAPLNKIINTEVEHDPRKFGRSNYNFIRYAKISFNLLINYSSAPLKIIGIIGVLTSIISIGFGLWIIIEHLINPTYGIMGWNSLMIAITFLGGAILMSIGIIGEYLRRILAEVSYAQPYVIEEIEL
jgi:Glycosyltransferases involved in cell wall biogenesis